MTLNAPRFNNNTLLLLFFFKIKFSKGKCNILSWEHLVLCAYCFDITCPCVCACTCVCHDAHVVIYLSNAWSIEIGYVVVSHSLCLAVALFLALKQSLMFFTGDIMVLMVIRRRCYVITFIQHKTDTIHASAECLQTSFTFYVCFMSEIFLKHNGRCP